MDYRVSSVRRGRRQARGAQPVAKILCWQFSRVLFTVRGT